MNEIVVIKGDAYRRTRKRVCILRNDESEASTSRKSSHITFFICKIFYRHKRLTTVPCPCLLVKFVFDLSHLSCAHVDKTYQMLSDRKNRCVRRPSPNIHVLNEMTNDIFQYVKLYFFISENFEIRPIYVKKNLQRINCRYLFFRWIRLIRLRIVASPVPLYPANDRTTLYRMDLVWVVSFLVKSY